jgi:replicative DNA helicase
MSVNIKKDFGTSRRRPDLSTLVYGKVPPQASELEEAVLGACMLEKETFKTVMEIVPSEECFYVDAHQKIYGAMKRVYDRGDFVDLLTITEELRKANDLELVGGAYKLTMLTQVVLTSAHVEHHARIMMEKWMLREVIRICGAAIGDAYEDSTDPFDLLDRVDKEVQAIGEGMMVGAQPAGVGEVFMHVLEQYQQQKERKSALLGVDTGYTELNEITLGWIRGDFDILAARPSQGKTALALNLAMNAVSSTVSPAGEVLVYSLEAKRDPLVRRMAAAKCDLPLKPLRRGNLTDAQEGTLRSYITQFNKMPIRIDDQTYELKKIEASIRRQHKRYLKRNARNKPEEILPFMVLVDYLQLVKVAKENTREQEVSSISRAFKLLAMELDIIIIALSQMNRNVENKPTKRPTLADLRESGALEQDGQVIMFIWHEKVEGKDNYGEPKVNTWIVIAKNKDGECKDVKLKFAGDIQRWMDWNDWDQGGPRQASFISKVYSEPAKKNDIDEDAPF